MLRSTRATLAVGLCLVGVAGLVGRSFGQGRPGRPAGRRHGRRPPRPPSRAAPAAASRPSIGSIDMDNVLKNYDKFKVATETIRAEALARHNELMKIATEAKQEQEKFQRMTPGSPDAKKCEDKITQLKAQFEAGRENAEREFTQKEAETMATIYNEIADHGQGRRQAAGDDLRGQVLRPARQRQRAQLGHGRHVADDPLRRPQRRHHRRRDQVAELPLQGQRRPGPQERQHPAPRLRAAPGDRPRRPPAGRPTAPRR